MIMRALLSFALLMLMLMWSRAEGADLCAVIAIPDADRVVIRYQGLPVDVPLAYVDAPSEGPARTACQQRLSKLLTGRKVALLFRPSFGTDASGAARVQLTLDRTDVNSLLVADGYARFRPGVHSDSDYDDPVRHAQERAQSGKVGIWSHDGVWASTGAAGETTATTPAATADAPASAPAADQAVSAKTPAPAAESIEAPAKPGAAPASFPGPFCSEIDSKYYFPSGHKGVASVNPQRLIFYADEADAQKAGKAISPQIELDTLPSDATEAGADQVYAKGKLIYTQAIDAGNNSNRDALYARAFVILSAAMRTYSALVEAHPNDDALGEKLHQCMQFRYGSLKQRRFE
jgi:endonuclease YncB( thermonuclease family)